MCIRDSFYGGESNARFDKSCSLTLKETPLKFESGTQPIEGVIGMAAAMDYLDAIGKENIHAHEVELKEYFLKKAEALGNIVVYLSLIHIYSIACQNLSLEYKALASRPLSSKDPTINERQYRIAKEIMDLSLIHISSVWFA